MACNSYGMGGPGGPPMQGGFAPGGMMMVGGPPAGFAPGGMVMMTAGPRVGHAGFSAPARSADVFVEVSPEMQPNFARGPNGVFVMDLPPIRVRLATNCVPPLPAEQGLAPFKPYEEFFVEMPEVSRVIFDPARGMPPNFTVTAQARKRGAVLEAPSNITMNAQLKANSPYGSLLLEDLQVANGMKQKIGESRLDYRLQVEGQLSVNPGAGNFGANRLEVDLLLSFTCSLQTGVDNFL
ncbi:unnamed protein product [Polarella glacialis]|uniref:Uncharacterized protein n=1 Tax=Polarella glacialis TaxID=89957 RepID=A0A813EDF2_POLGL|nr:unnamed protein product [Polarella glacialis]CAE8645180.1 unnamed protein product [Polarella glacialis]